MLSRAHLFVLLSFTAATSWSPSWAQNSPVSDLTCHATSVHDGDSIRVRCPGHKKTLPVRLDQIDAPELDQAYGIKSRDHLRSLCPVGATVVVKQPGKDRYNRTLGEVYCDGVNLNEALVAAGSAWVYDTYVRDKSLYALQNEAKSQRRGLWANRQALEPWKFRRRPK